MTSVACPFSRLNINEAERPAQRKLKMQQKSKKKGAQQTEEEVAVLKCPVDHGRTGEEPRDQESSPKCPLGYDSGSFKIGPLSCVICTALLYDCSRCVPCSHIYCRGCISRFQDCLLCGAEIERIESYPELQQLVEQYIEGHGRIKRPISPAGNQANCAQTLYEGDVTRQDVSLARGSFLIQQAMRAFQAKNLDSAKSRLSLCADDTREELIRSGTSSYICSQLGAVLGMLGDCCRSMGDCEGAAAQYEESVQLLTGLEDKDAEVVHALSVSLNKLGDLKYYGQDLPAAFGFYVRALDFRRNATDFSKLSSQALDVVVSIAKVADVNRAMGNEAAAREGFQEAIKTLEDTPSKGIGNLDLEKRRLSMLEFIRSQMTA